VAIDTRHRDESGEISRKHGNTLIRTFRKTYGQSFAEGCSDNNEKLSDVLHKLGQASLSRLIRDHDEGKPRRNLPRQEAGRPAPDSMNVSDLIVRLAYKATFLALITIP
jgi:hypothetical protein